MSALNRSIRAFLTQNKPPFRIAEDLEEFIRLREQEAATCNCKQREEEPFDPDRYLRPLSRTKVTKITKRGPSWG